MRCVRVSGPAVLLAFSSVLVGAVPVAAQDESPTYTNLQVLPPDISRGDLGEIMLANLRGLGLRRRGGEGCLHCHEGSMDTPRDTWDYASDAKPAKDKSRVMMAMVREINDDYLARIEARPEPAVEVGCYTCHAGRINPTPLRDLLIREHRAGGLAELIRTYREARARYYEADAYDFRVETLVDVANQLVDMGSLDDAEGVHRLNIEYFDDPRAYSGLIQLQLVQSLESTGDDGLERRYSQLKDEHPPEAFSPLTLDPLAWRWYRSGLQVPALILFELNFREYPGSFAATESLAYAVFGAGDEERGLGLARSWIEANPDHEGGHQLLAELLR